MKFHLKFNSLHNLLFISFLQSTKMFDDEYKKIVYNFSSLFENIYLVMRLTKL